jgi:murein DD-endopeptidase MepM/ murein hydrolase activator NlpD
VGVIDGVAIADRPSPRSFGHAPSRPRQRAAVRSRLPLALGSAILLLSSGLAWASLAEATSSARDSTRQWQALTVQPLAEGGRTGLRMAPVASVEAIDIVPVRAGKLVLPTREAPLVTPAPAGPMRIRGRAGDGLYWSLRAAGASPEVAAQYLAALASEIDVGSDVARGDAFDLIFSGGAQPQLLYAGLSRSFGGTLQLVRWGGGASGSWIDAAKDQAPQPVETGMLMPAAGHITSYFGNRYHPILHFTRFHAGIDIGAAWGSPIVAAADGQVVGAGWAGGYGRQVQIAHGGGMVSSYSHMSDMVVAPGTYVHRGQLIGYVGSSGLSTGPHTHFEVRENGVPINPLGARLVSAPRVDPHLADAVRARLARLLTIGTKRA